MRLELLELERRHQLLLLKELQQTEQQLLHRQTELAPVLSPVLQISSPPSLPSSTRTREQETALVLSPVMLEFLEQAKSPLPEKDSTPQP